MSKSKVTRKTKTTYAQDFSKASCTVR